MPPRPPPKTTAKAGPPAKAKARPPAKTMPVEVAPKARPPKKKTPKAPPQPKEAMPEAKPMPMKKTAKAPAQRSCPMANPRGSVAQVSVEDVDREEMERMDEEVERMHASLKDKPGYQGCVDYNPLEVFVSLASHMMSLSQSLKLLIRFQSVVSGILSLVFRMSSMCVQSLQSGCAVVNPWHYVLLLIFELVFLFFLRSV